MRMYKVIIIQKFIKLTDLEIVLIRFHMGGFIAKEDYLYFNTACNICPEIKLLNTADIEATLGE